MKTRITNFEERRGYSVVTVTDEAGEPLTDLHIRHHDGFIGWMSDWSVVDLLEQDGQIHHVHLGQDTYGEVKYYLS